MSLLRLLAKRVALGAVAAWAVLSTVFTAYVLTPDFYLGAILARAARGGSTERVREVREEYLAERGLDQPAPELYVDWMTNMFTLQWGESFETGEAVLPAVVRAVGTTASYVVPAILVATLLGTAVGLYAALAGGSLRERVGRSVAYVALGLPNVWLGALVLVVAGGVGFTFTWRQTALRPTPRPFLYSVVLPAGLVATALVATVASYARAYSQQYLSAEFVKLVRAKGGGEVDVARHVLRNAAIPLVSLVFTETLALLAVSVFAIEAIFGIDGIGLLFYNAVWTTDLPMLLGGFMAVVAFGVVGNVLQDVGYSVLDPRVDTGSR